MRYLSYKTQSFSHQNLSKHPRLVSNVWSWQIWDLSLQLLDSIDSNFYFVRPIIIGHRWTSLLSLPLFYYFYSLKTDRIVFSFECRHHLRVWDTCNSLYVSKTAFSNAINDYFSLKMYLGCSDLALQRWASKTYQSI